ncbi:MAG: NAD(P)-dependent alcohol dehydrogenase [Acidobacteriota bacterium]
MSKARGFAAHNAASPLAYFEFERREPGQRDVQIEILFCGVCHTDLHIARNEWKSTNYPVVPGHEIVGRVTRAGTAVRGFKAGDIAAVGCMVDSCRECADCADSLEQFCRKNPVLTYNSRDVHTGKQTYGGYSDQIVVDEHFVLRVSEKQNLAAVAPLLCAGITTYSPLRHWNVSKGRKVGIVGLGGLGHMGVKLAHALGAHVVLFTSSPSKTEDAVRMGADEVVITKSPDDVKKHANSLDFILNTISFAHDLDSYINLLKRDGTMCLVGAPATPHPSPSVMNLILQRRQLAGSLIGGIKETQEMLDFCDRHNIVSDVEVIPIQRINDAYERMLRSDVRYRFVIDVSSLRR